MNTANPENGKVRTLASLQTVAKLEPIPGADAIEKATVLGWSVVVKKNEFQVGSPCVYIEIDSVLPERPEFEFLRAKHFRIKTVRLRGQISQGICFPVSILPGGELPPVGTDLTELLGVTKFEAPIPACLAGEVVGGFPGWLPKTDETRIQSVPLVLERWPDTEVYISEKVDGSSMTVFWAYGRLGVCSRNLELKESDKNSLWLMARQLDLENKLRVLSEENAGARVALQGELAGRGVQANRQQLEGLHFLVFNIYVGCRYLDLSEFLPLCAHLGLETVPILTSKIRLGDLGTIPDLVKLATRPSAIGKGYAEGIVIRPTTECVDGELGRLSFKVINPEYLLQHGE